MKKIFAASMTLSLLLSGCGALEVAETTVPEITASETLLQTDSSIAAETEAEIRSLPITVSVRQDNMDGYDQENGDTKVLDFDFQWLSVVTPENAEAGEKITGDLEEQTRVFYEGMPDGMPLGAEQSLQYALEGLSQMGPDFYPYAVERTYAPSQHGRILDIAMSDYAYLGGAHGSHSVIHLAYDSKTGERLHLEDLTAAPEELKSRLLSIMVELAKTEPSISQSINWLTPDEYEEGLQPLLRDGAWHFEGDLLIISSQEYELGAYAAGTVDFPIAISEIQDLIKPQYLREPLENGSLFLLEQSDLPLAGKLSRGEFQSELVLVPEGTVYDVSLRELNTYPDSEALHEGNLLWFCGEMKDCALGLSVEIPELIPNLLVTYRTADGVLHKQALTQSGEDGHYFLMDVELY